MATQRIPAYPVAAPFGDGPRKLAASLDALLAQSPLEQVPEMDLLPILRSGGDSPRTVEAIVWGINTLRARIGVKGQFDLKDFEFVNEDELRAFLVEAIDDDLRRQRLLEFLSNPEPVWKDEDHPDIVAVGTAAWVHNLRREESVRLAGRDEYLDPITPR